MYQYLKPEQLFYASGTKIHRPQGTAIHRHKKFNRLLCSYVVTDLAALLLGFLCSWEFAAALNTLLETHLSDPPSGHVFARLSQFCAITCGIFLCLQYAGHYSIRMPFWLEVKQVFTTLGIAMLADSFIQFAYKENVSRLWLVTGWAIAAIFMIVLRGMARSYFMRIGVWQLRTLLIGTGHTAQATRTATESEPGLGYEITASISDFPRAFLQAGRSWKKLCRHHHVEYILIALDGADIEKAKQPIAQLMREDIPFSISPPLHQLPVLGMMPQYFLNHDVMLLTHNRGLEQSVPQFVKRAFDLFASACALLLLSPAMLAIAALVKRDKGPVFFRHLRVGRNGKPFYCLKFRSMCMDSERILELHLANHPEARAEWREYRKLRHDPRISRIGSFLRNSSLDELPQLFNVIRGEMSLVGPRPIMRDEMKNYGQDIAYYYRVRPGISGLWQVSGRNDVTYAQRVKMDSWYVRNWSLWHDIAILFKTLPALLGRNGAY